MKGGSPASTRTMEAIEIAKTITRDNVVSPRFQVGAGCGYNHKQSGGANGNNGGNNGNNVGNNGNNVGNNGGNNGNNGGNNGNNALNNGNNALNNVLVRNNGGNNLPNSMNLNVLNDDINLKEILNENTNNNNISKTLVMRFEKIAKEVCQKAVKDKLGPLMDKLEEKIYNTSMNNKNNKNNNNAPMKNNNNAPMKNNNNAPMKNNNNAPMNNALNAPKNNPLNAPLNNNNTPVQNGGGSDWASTHYSRGPVNNPSDLDTFSKFAEPSQYVSNEQLMKRQ